MCQCVWDNLCVRPKVGNAILYELQTNTNKSQFGHANCTKFKKIYSQQGRQASPIMTIYTNYTVNLAQRLQEGEVERGGVAQTKYNWNCWFAARLALCTVQQQQRQQDNQPQDVALQGVAAGVAASVGVAAWQIICKCMRMTFQFEFYCPPCC